ncbi:MAG: sigma-70 family RNA polymerase sigma factor [Bacteroidota bacterium]
MAEAYSEKKKELEQLFLTNYQTFLNLGMSLCGQREFVKDTIQLFFLDLWEQKWWEKEIADPKAYLYRSFYRKLFSELKKSRKYPSQSLELWEEKIYALSDDSNAFQADVQEIQDHLRKALSSLPEKQQEMIRLKFKEGLDYEEIASYTGKSKQTIYNQIHSSIKKLRAHWQQTSDHLKKK